MGPVMPVIVIDNAADAVPLADALLEGGLRTIEITLRTPAALGAIEAIARTGSEICIGTRHRDIGRADRSAIDAGAKFAVSPGTTADVIDGCADVGLPCARGRHRFWK